MKNQKLKRNKTLRKILIGFSIGIFTLIAGGLIYIITQADELIHNQLTSYIHTQTDSTYHLNYSELNFSLFRRTIEISNVEFLPNSIRKTDSLHNLYQFQTKSIILNRIKYKALLRESRLVAEQLQINHPKFELTSGEKVDFKSLMHSNLNTGDSILIPVFTEIFFDTIRISNAKLNIDTLFNTKYELPQINILATHFKLGGKKFTDTPYPFDVSDISLTIENLNEDLADGIHKVSIQKVSLSLLTSTILAQNVNLSPRSDTLQTADNRYSISVPQIKLNTSIINNNIQTDTISIDRVELINPEIEIVFGQKIRKGTPLNQIDFYKLIGEKTEWIKVEHFKVKNADVRFIPSSSKKVAQHFENLFINFYNFKIDSTSYQNPNRILSAEQINFSLRLFTLHHTDEIHTLTIGNLKVDSKTKRIASGMVKFKPSKILNSNQTTIDIQSDGLILKSVDLLSFYHKQKFPMEELLLKNPSININYNTRKTVSRDLQDKSLILEKTEDYLKGIYVTSAIIQNGILKYNYKSTANSQGFFSTGFNFDLTNLSVDSATFYQSDKIFFADDFQASFTNVDLQLADESHRLKTKSIEISSPTKSAEIINFQIIPLESSMNDSLLMADNREIYDILFPKIVLNGADLHEAFFNKKLNINNFSIYNPIFNIQKYGSWTDETKENTPYQNAIYGLISDFLFDVKVDNLNIVDGTLNLTQMKQLEPEFELSNQFSVSLKGFEINNSSLDNKRKLLFSDNIDLVLKDQSFTFADGVHKLNAKEIGILSSSKHVYLKDANLYPDILAEGFNDLPMSIFATIPMLEISKADVFRLFNDGHLPMEKMVVSNPEIRLLFQENTKQRSKADKPILLLDELKSISTKQIKIINGYLELSKYTDNKTITYANTELDFEISDFKIVQKYGKLNSFYSDFSFNMEYLTYHLPDQIHTLNIDQIQYQQSKKEILLKQLRLRPNNNINQNEKRQYFRINFPELSIADIDLKEYLNSNNLSSSHISISNPSFALEDKRIENTSSFSPFNLNLYNYTKSFANSIKINNIDIQNLDLQINKNKPIKLYDIDIEAQNLIADKSGTNSNKMFHSQHINFVLNNVTGRTKQEYFEYRIQQFKLNEQGDFSIDRIDLSPLYSEKEFASKNKIQADYFTIENGTINGKGLNLKDAIENNRWSMPELSASIETFKIHRDKTYPIADINKKLPQEALRDLKSQLDINKALITIGRFDYTELEPRAIKKSNVFVENSTVQINNFTNIPSNLKINPLLNGRITGLLMGKGSTTIDIDLNVKSLGNEFTFDAHIDEIPLSMLNPITEPGLKLSIKEGLSNSFDVFFEANEDSAIGTMRFAYNDLKVAVLNRKGKEIKEGKFVSFLINNVALKTDNPKPGRIMIPAKFEKKRDKQRSMVGYCWQSIFAGIKSTLGLKNRDK